MRWGKIVLLFQAIVTLVIGLIFFAQVMTLDQAKIEELKVEIAQGDIFFEEGAEPEFIDVKARFQMAGYVLLIISLIEIVLISQLIS
ncbi:hypothetical protein HOA55_04375 [archaeon]|jgi:hypothetical protein|nr:hypothetical protein [archaeon]MBT3577962.1 hypothetical protein [archaeon]MBT6820565.1 hypothetical protein [archaeon]MBT6955934.1 hypothetical protein [archaeon]MBT7025816.1 hypothetical protein [archaeon]